MSERTQHDLDALREGLRLVDEWRKTHEDRARMARVEATAEMERCHCGGDAEIARLTRELEAARAALTIAETTAANLHDTIRLRDRELAAARSHARRLCVALRAIRDEAAIGGPPLESRREDWEAAMDEADEVLGELEALYGE